VNFVIKNTNLIRLIQSNFLHPILATQHPLPNNNIVVFLGVLFIIYKPFNKK